jgi:molybdate transport system substrate-binding protein
MIRRRLLGIVAALAATLALSPAAAFAQKPVTVFAAASLTNALNEVGAVYKTKTGKDVRFSFAASSAIARQIEQGAPADLFVSADEDWMNYVQNKNLILAPSRVNLLSNRLALIAPATSTTKLVIGKNFTLDKELGAGRLSMAGPDVPAGKYGQAALTSLGVWKSVETKTVRGENVRAALQFVARGEAPFGIVYDTDAKVEPKVKIVGLFPVGSHPNIIYPAALIAGPSNPDAASFFYFLRGPEAAAVFAKYGFTKPKT